jgi:hypothetical protein
MTAGQKGPLYDTMGTLVISPQGVLGDTYPDVSGRRKGGDYRRRYITALRSRIIQKTSQLILHTVSYVRYRSPRYGIPALLT